MPQEQDLAKRVDKIAEKSRKRRAVKPTVRKPPKKEVSEPPRYDLATKDNRSIMDVAVFRLSKKDKRAGQVIHYTLPNGYLEVKAGPDGMASVWDYDIVLMAISQLAESVNKYRKGEGPLPGRLFRPKASEILKFCRRPAGGKQKDDLVGALSRLTNTVLQMERTIRLPNGKNIVESEGEGLINNYRVVSREKSGKVDVFEIELPRWLYEQVVEMESPDILTVHPDFFLIDLGIGRFLYRLARKSAGKSEAAWLFRTIYERSGSGGSFKKFCFRLRELIKANDLPEYELSGKSGKGGPMLMMKYKGS